MRNERLLLTNEIQDISNKKHICFLHIFGDFLRGKRVLVLHVWNRNTQVLRPERTFCKVSVPNMELSSLRHVVRYWMKYGLRGGTYDLINSRVRIDFKQGILTLDLVRSSQ